MSLTKRLLSVLALLSTVFSAQDSFAQGNPNLPRPRSSAPPLQLETVVGAPVGTAVDWAHLRGKVVVLEFWATWCAPCIGEIPAINALVKSLDPAKVQSISISDEDPAKVNAFLKNKPISGWIGIDTTSHVFDRYGVVARPATIVVDAKGKIVSNSVPPDGLSSTQLLALAKGRSNSITESSDSKVKARSEAARSQAFADQFSSAGAGQADTGGSKDALFSLSLTASSADGVPHLYFGGPQSYDVLGASIKILLIKAFGYNNDRITMDESAFPKQAYNLSVHAKDVPEDALRAAVETALCSGTSTQIEHHKSEEDVLLLQKMNGVSATAAAQEASGLAFYDEKKSSAVMMTASSRQIASLAEDALGIPVMDESDSAAICNGNGKIAKGDQAALRELLQKRCGLTLVPGRRVVDRIKVNPAVRLPKKF